MIHLQKDVNSIAIFSLLFCPSCQFALWLVCLLALLKAPFSKHSRFSIPATCVHLSSPALFRESRERPIVAGRGSVPRENFRLLYISRVMALHIPSDRGQSAQKEQQLGKCGICLFDPD